MGRVSDLGLYIKWGELGRPDLLYIYQPIKKAITILARGAKQLRSKRHFVKKETLYKK